MDELTLKLRITDCVYEIKSDASFRSLARREYWRSKLNAYKEVLESSENDNQKKDCKGSEMKIKIDYVVTRKDTGKVINIIHLTLNEDNILEMAQQKAKDIWNIPENEDYVPQIDQVIV